MSEARFDLANHLSEVHRINVWNGRLWWESLPPYIEYDMDSSQGKSLKSPFP